jgi:hypothetical protein
VETALGSSWCSEDVDGRSTAAADSSPEAVEAAEEAVFRTTANEERNQAPKECRRRFNVLVEPIVDPTFSRMVDVSLKTSSSSTAGSDVADVKL